MSYVFSEYEKEVRRKTIEDFRNEDERKKLFEKLNEFDIDCSDIEVRENMTDKEIIKLAKKVYERAEGMYLNFYDEGEVFVSIFNFNIVKDGELDKYKELIDEYEEWLNKDETKTKEEILLEIKKDAMYDKTEEFRSLKMRLYDEKDVISWSI